jgi:hypothetical protein
MVVCRPSCRTASALNELSRAIKGLTSVVARDSTPRKTRSISVPGFAILGDLVVRGPLITTPIRSPTVGMTRSPDRARRERLGLVKSSCETTVHPLRSTDAIRTLPLMSMARPDAIRDDEASVAILPLALRAGGITSRRGVPWPPPPPG